MSHYDKKDKRIIRELILNSRIPINKLAKNVGISREVASYRLKKLKKDIIKELYTSINITVLDHKRLSCFVQLKGISAEGEKRFFDYLINHEYITAMSPVIGRWNVVFDILARDDEHLESIIKDITKKIVPYLKKYTILGTSIKEGVFPTKILGVKEQRFIKTKSGKLKIDQTDKKILKLFSDNARIEYKEISKELNLTANAVRYRVRNLEKKGIIQGYTISLDLRKLNYDLYNVQLKLNEVSNSKLVSFLRLHPQVLYYYRYLGHENWDIDIGVIVRDSMDLRNFILELRKNFGEVIEIYDIYLIVDILKEHIPKGIFAT